jgi:hypothetical protein
VAIFSNVRGFNHGNAPAAVTRVTPRMKSGSIIQKQRRDLQAVYGDGPRRLSG